jgi:hypothetical protein
MRDPSIALLIFGKPGSTRNALTEEKYSKLATHFSENGFAVESILYHDSIADKLAGELTRFAAILVWVNPIEQETDRKILDALLSKLSGRGCFVSAHPDTILKIGTKEILHRMKDEQFGNDVNLYHSFEAFKEKFLSAPEATGIRVLKQYRGNGGNGVFKIDISQIKNNRIGLTHATEGEREIAMTIEEFFTAFEPYFSSGHMVIDQAWNPHITNGMVRCYLSGNKVAGFGYQEVNALYPPVDSVFKKPGQRFYFSEDCGLFADLRQAMENNWVSRLLEITGMENESLPVIWDADFFINRINEGNTSEKYSLCEINASCVSPFPGSSIPFMVEEVKRRINP